MAVDGGCRLDLHRPDDTSGPLICHRLVNLGTALAIEQACDIGSATENHMHL